MSDEPRTSITIGRTRYEVERKESDNMPYALVGPRGAIYYLCRNRVNRNMLFLVNGRSLGGNTPAQWVRETEAGELVVVR